MARLSIYVWYVHIYFYIVDINLLEINTTIMDFNDKNRSFRNYEYEF